MTDVVDRATRSRMMSGIRGADTAPEKQIRSMLHRNGFRFSLYRQDLPGKPDIVLPKYRAVIFVHGCFWHRHCCALFKWPKSNAAFWRTKINANAKRDKLSISKLIASNWRVLIIWECAIKGAMRVNPPALIDAVTAWIESDALASELSPKIK